MRTSQENLPRFPGLARFVLLPLRSLFPSPSSLPRAAPFLRDHSPWSTLLTSHRFPPLSGRRRFSDRANILADLLTLPERGYRLSMRRARVSHLREILLLFLRARSMPKIHFYSLLPGRPRSRPPQFYFLELAISRALLLFPGLPRFFKLPILPGVLALARPGPAQFDFGIGYSPSPSPLSRAPSIL
jgi:hypothetical protein